VMLDHTTYRRSLLAATLVLFVGGCYSAQCEKMGFAEGTPENARCVYQLQMDMAHSLNNIAQQMQKSSGSSYSGSSYSGSSYSRSHRDDGLSENGCWLLTGRHFC
jgi:hypothetical protein